MSTSLKSGRYPIESRLPYVQSRIKEIKSIVDAGFNPLHVVVCTVGGETKLTIRDVINYMEHFAIPFSGVASSFQLVGENNEREAIIC